ncbi:hypothetical protein ACQ4PT_027452 [Festuca glaucescens]
MATARLILGSSAWAERLGMDTASKSDMGSFCITAWTDDPAVIPKSKKLWLAEPLVFDEDEDDLLLPVEALVLEEVALLEFEATVHIVRVEGEARSAGHSEAGGGRDDGQDGVALGQDGGGRGGSAPRGTQLPGATGARGPVAPPRRWRGGPERRVALGHTVDVRPWPVLEQPVVRMEAPRAAPTQARVDVAVIVESPPLSPRGASPSSEEADVASAAGQLGAAAVRSRPSPTSSASIQDDDLWWWPKGKKDGALSPIGPLSPSSSSCFHDSFEGRGRWTQSPMSMFTVELSRASPPVTRHAQEAQVVEVEDGEIVEEAQLEAQPPLPTAAVVPSTPVGSSSVDTNYALAAFRERCRLKKATLLPRPVARKPRAKRPPPSVVRRSTRVAGRFSSGASIKQQQKTLMIQLEIAREGEVISEETLQAYLHYFEEKPMSAEHLTACLALFGWLPDVLPVVEDGDVDVVV